MPEREADVTRYAYGTAIQEAKVGGATAAVSYYDATNEHLVFNVEITNNGKEAFDFDPAAILLIAEPNVVPAIDPELYLLDIDLTAAKAARKSEAWGWIGAGVLIAGSIALAVDANAEGLNDAVLAETLVGSAADAALLVSYNAQDRRNNLYAAPNDLPTPAHRAFWLDQALRISTVRPGETVFGKLVFPRQDQTTRMAVKIPMPTGDLRFEFTQVVRRP